jgi:hypothetical protein
MHSRPLSLAVLQSATSKSTLVPAFINKIFRAMFEYRSSDCTVYSCDLEDINNFEDILNYISDAKREILDLSFSSGLKELGYSPAEVANIER